jgi:hypothetical protein
MRGFLDGFIGCDLPLIVNTTTALSPVSPQHLTLESLLPTTGDIPVGMTQTGTRNRTLTEVAANYSDPPETVDLFTLMGWKGNVTVSFEGTGTDLVSIYVSIHEFATAEDAALAMDWSAADQSLSTGANLSSTPLVGDSCVAMGLYSGENLDFTLYSQTGPYLIRVTVSGSDSNAESVARTVVESIAAEIRS